MRSKIIMHINYLYSIVWIAATRTDKYEYREHSRVHAALMNMIKMEG